jgi:Tfp pilus assembly protein PilO
MRQRGPLIAGIAGGLAAILVIVFLIVPKLGDIRHTQDDLSAAIQQQQELQTQLAQLKATEARAKEIRTQLALLDAAVPAEADLPDLIRTLNDTADQSGVAFMSLSPGQPTSVEGSAPVSGTPGATTFGSTSLPVGISVIPMSIQIEGSYFAVDEYLFRLETLPRLSKVVTISLTTGSGGYPTLALQMSANFYTTDVSAGPGSVPGSQTSGGAPPSTTGTSVPQASPTPSGSPSPTP